MGQTPSPAQNNAQEELQLVDEAAQLYLNVSSRRMYTKRSMVVGDIADREHELDVYLFRRLNDRFVVSVDYCSSPQETEMCSSYTALTYFIEHQQATLLDKTTLPLAQGFTLIRHVLQGFSILYNKFGYFTPNARLVFFNHLDQAKVWISQDLKVTRNVQCPHGPKNITQENMMVRETVRLFDGLRDTANPMARYSQFLPANFLTFQFAIDCFLKRSVELSCKNVPQKQVLAELKNIKPQQSPPLPIKHHPVSYQNSPIVSPRQAQSPRYFKKENPPVLNFTYQSPKASATQTPVRGGGSSLEKEEIKQAAKMSLKNTSLGVRPYHAMQPSREFTSTMPNSIRNSGVFERNIIIEKLDPTPTISRKNSVNDIKIDENQLKKAAQRYSEAEQHTISFESKPKPKFLKVSLEEQTKRASENVGHDTGRFSNQQYEQEKCSFKFLEKRAKNQSGPNLNDPPVRREYQGHKRHQTDFKLLERMRDSNDSQRNQISLMEGNYLSKFNLNTIKSIHLLDEDKELDHDIIVDLKHIINKYRRLA